ncbi:hypothetical protein ACFPLB_12280 [Aquamicrobium segne]|uniref:Transposase n=1 Tax=Aquamicrobium segne TaxID=469547 RepID=A0ABW0GYJ6_9HYPH
MFRAEWQLCRQGKKVQRRCCAEAVEALALVFGQIRPLKRPFGAVEARGLNGDVATLRPHQDDQTGNTGMSVRPCPWPRAFLLPASLAIGRYPGSARQR